EDPEFEKRSSGSRGFVEVEVHLTDGRSAKARVDKAPGSPARELTWDDLRLKFMDCARQSMSVTEVKAEQAFAAIQQLEDLDDIGSLIELLR
ncbi:MAG: hypothetical protein ACXWC3_15880, partial [Burkholderiales bacterium]